MKLHNTYFLLRHGEAVSNVKDRNSSWPETFRNPLTPKGKKQIMATAKKLKKEKIDLIFASDLLRTKESAAIVSKMLKIPVAYDSRLREMSFGSLNGGAFVSLSAEANQRKRQISRTHNNAESYGQVSKRVWQFFKELEKKYQNQHILLVSHQAPLWLLEDKVKGISIKKAMQAKEPRINRAELRELT